MYFAGAVLQGTHPPSDPGLPRTQAGPGEPGHFHCDHRGWAANAAVKGSLRRPAAALDRRSLHAEIIAVMRPASRRSRTSSSPSGATCNPSDRTMGPCEPRRPARVRHTKTVTDSFFHRSDPPAVGRRLRRRLGVRAPTDRSTFAARIPEIARPRSALIRVDESRQDGPIRSMMSFL
jgi:hypothetical protein